MSDRLVIRRRNLPHWEMGGATYSITFRLFKTVSHVAPLTAEERACVMQSILSLHGSMWQVDVFTVMPDHVHIVATPRQNSSGEWYPLSKILRLIKGRTAREINIRRRRTGPLWQTESFDRIIRDRGEYDEKAAYILNNSVKQGLVEEGWEYDGFWCNEGTAG